MRSLLPVVRVKSLLKGKQHIRSQYSHAPLMSVKRKMTLSDAKCKKQSDALKVFKTVMVYPDKREESDVEVFENRLRTEVQEHMTMTIEIQEKGVIKWYFVMKISLERLTDNQEMGGIQSYFRCQCVTKLIEDTISQNIEERFS